ncbi:nickel/cobalt transporter [Vibrio orientalis]|nr:hypothetical protein [Vibrio orientalis]
MIFAFDVQRGLSGELGELIYDIQENKEDVAIAFIASSFIYGVFHAFGAGHGKVLITSYLLTNQGTIPKAIGICFVTSMIQTFVAIVTVEIMLAIFASSMRDIHSAIETTITLSYVFVIGVGAYIMYQASRLPLVQERSVYGIMAAVGMRPCTGAVMVIMLANMIGLRGIGIISAIVMAGGTAFTTSVITCLAVSGKDTLASVFKTKKGIRIVQFAGGFLVAVFGYLLMYTDKHALLQI